MRVVDYLRYIFVPANAAVSALRRAGLPWNATRATQLITEWEALVKDREKYLIGEAAARGITLSFGPKHGLSKATRQGLTELFYGASGLGLEIKQYTDKGVPSLEDEALLTYASINFERPTDVPQVRAYLDIQSYAKGMGTYLRGMNARQRWDGAVHPRSNWAKVRTARISMKDPNLQNIPERSNAVVALGIKSCFIPRCSPAPAPEAWDPRLHGSVFRWDINAAEAAIRGGMLTHRLCSAPEWLWEYIRLGKDPHGRVASEIFGKPEGTNTKGMVERDGMGKQVFFATLFGGGWPSVQHTIWTKTRIWLSKERSIAVTDRVKAGTPRLQELYERDAHQLGRHGYVQDGYGRRRFIGLPDGVTYRGVRDGYARFDVPRQSDADRRARKPTPWQLLQRARHTAANSPTQSTNATDNFWMLALCTFGEYVELRVPPMWDSTGVLFPEAKPWQMNEGPGPGGKPFRSWHTNTVHDSGWGDCAPGYLEPTMKTIMRRCTALPFDWRLQADVPYRIDFACGPDHGHLQDYNKVAARFGLEPYPVR